MGQIGSMIAAAATPGLMSAPRMLDGVKPEMYARLARPGGQVVHSNHAAFVLGHLALYPVKVLARLGQPAGVTAHPAEWVGLFEAGAECRDDPDGRIYPPLATLREHFLVGYESAQAAVRNADDAIFLAPNPAEGRSRELFPTVGALVNFYLGGHVMNHLGQLSAWRRAMGLPSAF